MFRDTKEELDRLEHLLRQAQPQEEDVLRENGPKPNTHPAEEELPGESIACSVKNTDKTDTDLNRYSQEVFEPPHKSHRLLAAIFVLLTLLLLTLGWLYLRREGLI